MNISGIEWLLLFVVALLLFGPKKLPELGKSIGKGIREFKKATSGILDDEEQKQSVQSTQNNNMTAATVASTATSMPASPTTATDSVNQTASATKK